MDLGVCTLLKYPEVCVHLACSCLKQEETASGLTHHLDWPTLSAKRPLILDTDVLVVTARFGDVSNRFRSVVFLSWLTEPKHIRTTNQETGSLNMCVHLENIRSLVLILATFEDCHVYDGADLGDLVLRRRGWGLLEVTASPADSG